MDEILGIQCTKASLRSRVDRREALVYMKQRGVLESDLDERFRSIAQACEEGLVVRGAWRTLPLVRTQDDLHVAGTPLVLEGENVRRHLDGASHVVLMAFTLGTDCERIARRYQAKSPLDALMFDACASSLVDAGADDFQSQIESDLRGLGYCRAGYRFSPGYGDFPLDIQPAFLDALDAGRNLGIFATDDHFMQPSKSITAVLGVKPSTSGLST